MNHPIFVMLVADVVACEYRKRINLLIAPVFQVTSIQLKVDVCICFVQIFIFEWEITSFLVALFFCSSAADV